MNAHQRRVSERARNIDRFKAVRAPNPAGDFIAIGTNFAALSCKPDPVYGLSSQPAGFQFIPGASVRNTRTKTVATMLSRHAKGEQHSDGLTEYLYDGIDVKRRDNRTVYWPLSECENWNL